MNQKYVNHTIIIRKCVTFFYNVDGILLCMNFIKTIFLIDDDVDEQEIFVRILDQLDNVRLLGIVNNGRQALETLKNAATLPDIIFLDYNMPGMNGIECLQAIKNNSKTKHIKVIMLSGAAEQAETACKFGAEAFIQKSFDTTTYTQAFNKIINHNTIHP